MLLETTGECITHGSMYGHWYIMHETIDDMNPWSIGQEQYRHLQRGRYSLLLGITLLGFASRHVAEWFHINLLCSFYESFT